MGARIKAAVIALGILAAMLSGGHAADAAAKRVQYACSGNGYTLIVDTTWANFLSNQGWHCRRVYQV